MQYILLALVYFLGGVHSFFLRIQTICRRKKMVKGFFPSYYQSFVVEEMVCWGRDNSLQVRDFFLKRWVAKTLSILFE